jgi:hypothetical protein
VYPVSGNGVWQDRIDKLKQRISLFNGKRVVAILYENSNGSPWPTGACWPNTTCYRHSGAVDPPDMVEERLSGLGFTVFKIKNDPNRREVATFGPLFNAVCGYKGFTDATIYAHAKGVTRNPQHTAHRWTDLLYESMMDYWPVVEDLLTVCPVAGSFLKAGHGWADRDSKSAWHYSGSWFWFRNIALFNLPDWHKIDQFWSGIEPYPSLHFPIQQAGVVFHQGVVPNLNMYSHEYIDRVVMPEWEQWKQLNSQNRTDTGSYAAWCPTI